MSKIAFVFSGQGAQYTGMGKSFYDEFNISKEIFDRASKALDLDMKHLCFEENERLNITEYTQPAILTTSIAMLKAFEETGIKPDVVAGLSLGEYSALVANDALRFDDAVKIVKKRGKLMQDTVPVGVGAMAAIIGLDSKVIEEVSQNIKGKVETANYNSPGQIVISGEDQAVKEAVEELKIKGAKRAIILNVSGPFHSTLLKPAGVELQKVLDEVTFNKMSVPYVSNVTARYVLDSEDIKPLLVRQVYSSVRWQQSVEKMISEGVDTFIEIGPGKTLRSFIKKIDRKKQVFNIEESKHIGEIKEKLEV